MMVLHCGQYEGLPEKCKAIAVLQSGQNEGLPERMIRMRLNGSQRTPIAVLTFTNQVKDVRALLKFKGFITV